MPVVIISYDLIGRDETSDDYKRLIEKIKIQRRLGEDPLLALGPRDLSLDQAASR